MVALHWEQSYLQDPSSVISTQTMGLDEFNTQMDEFGRNPAFKSDLTEDEIERAIEEIRNTIDKYTPKN